MFKFIGERIPGEIDFYLNSDLSWGIELLVQGRGISEHIDRFGPHGKYSALGVNDYAVVDFRRSIDGKATNVGRNEKRITIFFQQQDFNSCECIFGNNPEPVRLNLRA